MSRAAAADPRGREASRWLAAQVAAAAAAPTVTEAGHRLAPLFRETGWLGALAEAWLAPMARDAAAAPVLPAMRNGPVVNLTLASAPPVLLLLTLIEGHAERPDLPETAGPSIGFSGTQALYRLLSPHPLAASLGRIGRDGRCRTRRVELRPDRPLSLDERRLALRIAPQARAALLLRARITRRPAPPVRHFAVTTGCPLGTVQGDDGFARTAMLLSVLRAMGARQAAPQMMALLDRTSGPDRWIVMRELLALDAPAAWPALVRMAAAEPDHAVRRAARGVLARHAATNPVADGAPCPA